MERWAAFLGFDAPAVVPENRGSGLVPIGVQLAALQVAIGSSNAPAATPSPKPTGRLQG